MNDDTEITELVPIFDYLAGVSPQAGEVFEKKNIHFLVLSRRMEVMQAGTFKCQSVSYVAGTPNDYKAMLPCVAFKTEPLSL